MMKKTNTPPLVVYKASAGSGKTFTLAAEYIKLLIDNPLSFRNILAVTFTNKATEEMKTRILSQLNGLANGYADSSDYMKKISEETGTDPSLVKARASMALHGMIHNYDHFHVETIDKFFQRVLKNLARELDLTANLRIELNDVQIEQMAVDTMIDSLDHDNVVLGWIMNYILENIGKEKSWNVINQIKEFGSNIFKDIYKSHREEMHGIMSDEEFFNKFRSQLYKTKEMQIKTKQECGQRFFDAIGALTSSDFNKGKNGVYGYFEKMCSDKCDGNPMSATVASCLESAESWCKKKNPNREAVMELANSTLIALLEEADATRLRCYMICKSVDVTLNHLNQLRLLGNIEETVRRMNSDSNRFLLSDTQGMLHALIDDSDTPFIFEKIGTQLHHIMIDEFQDTGALQWSNFKVLLNECIHQGKSNLIVGDVKQSIYRWRSGDWRLLNNITSQFNNDSNLVKVAPLDTNYRSCKKIVEFNNKFFVAASQVEHQHLYEIMGNEANQLQAAYSDVVQKIPPKKSDEGYVHIEMMSNEEYDKTLMEKIAQCIRNLTEHGVLQKDIAILARRNGDIEATAQYFQANMPDINIVSDEAFILESSLAVNILITALKVLVDERDAISRCYLAKTYQNHLLDNGISDETLMLSNDTKHPEKSFSNLLPQGFRDSQDMSLLRSMPLIDLVETLHDIFEINRSEGQSAYLCTFYDIVREHLSEHPSDIERFLQAWDEKYSKKNIHGDEVDGIRIVTIHKSKGLEFDNVILPFCNWSLERKGNIIWCESPTPPFNSLPIIPINYSNKQMKDTVYEQDYQKEYFQNMVDNLNLLYVAFTRARTRMFIYGVKKDGDSKDKIERRSALIEQCIPQLLQPSEQTTPKGTIKLEPLDGTIEEDDLGTMTFEYGRCFEEQSIKKVKKESENIFLQSDISESFQIKSYPSTATFRQSNESKAFVDTDTPSMQSQYIHRGNMLHYIFSKIKYIDDIDDILQELTFQGLIGNDISSNELHKLLQQALANPQVRDWFTPKWTIHNECNILCKKGEELTTMRPDRVMSNGSKTIVVDFKFGNPDPLKHKEQVNKYISTLKEMGHSDVEGYVWYVFSNKVEKA